MAKFIPTHFWSRKLAGASLSAGALLIAWVLCQWLPLARENFGTLCTSIVSIFSVYAGVNVWQKAKTPSPGDK